MTTDLSYGREETGTMVLINRTDKRRKHDGATAVHCPLQNSTHDLGIKKNEIRVRVT